MNKSFLVLLGLTIGLGVVIGGAFVSGVALGKNQTPQASAAGLNGASNLQNFRSQGQDGAAGSQQQSGAGANGQANARQGLGGAGGVSGTIETIEGNVITLITAQGGRQQVTVSDATVIQRMAQATLADLKAGQQIVAAGQQDTDGNLNALRIMEQPAGGAPIFQRGGADGAGAGRRNQGGAGGRNGATPQP